MNKSFMGSIIAICLTVLAAIYFLVTPTREDNKPRVDLDSPYGRVIIYQSPRPIELFDRAGRQVPVYGPTPPPPRKPTVINE